MGNELTNEQQKRDLLLKENYLLQERPILIHKQTQKLCCYRKRNVLNEADKIVVKQAIGQYGRSRCESISHLQSHYHVEKSGYCSCEEYFYLIFQGQNNYTLREEVAKRRLQKKNFSQQQIQEVAQTYLCGLRQYNQRFHRDFDQISQDSIALEQKNGRITLKDPYLLDDYQKQQYALMQRFPSPEKLRVMQGNKTEEVNYFLSNLFGVGMICLSLKRLDIPEGVYYQHHAINEEEIRRRMSEIRDEKLRRGLGLLLSNNAGERRKIYQLWGIQNKQEHYLHVEKNTEPEYRNQQMHPPYQNNGQPSQLQRPPIVQDKLKPRTLSQQPFPTQQPRPAVQVIRPQQQTPQFNVPQSQFSPPPRIRPNSSEQRPIVFPNNKESIPSISSNTNLHLNLIPTTPQYPQFMHHSSSLTQNTFQPKPVELRSSFIHPSFQSRPQEIKMPQLTHIPTPHLDSTRFKTNYHPNDYRVSSSPITALKIRPSNDIEINNYIKQEKAPFFPYGQATKQSISVNISQKQTKSPSFDILQNQVNNLPYTSSTFKKPEKSLFTLPTFNIPTTTHTTPIFSNPNTARTIRPQSNPPINTDLTNTLPLYNIPVLPNPPSFGQNHDKLIKTVNLQAKLQSPQKEIKQSPQPKIISPQKEIEQKAHIEQYRLSENGKKNENKLPQMQYEEKPVILREEKASLQNKTKQSNKIESLLIEKGEEKQSIQIELKNEERRESLTKPKLQIIEQIKPEIKENKKQLLPQKDIITNHNTNEVKQQPSLIAEQNSYKVSLAESNEQKQQIVRSISEPASTGTPQRPTTKNKYNSTIVEVRDEDSPEHSMRSDDPVEQEYVVQQYETGSRYEGFKSNGMRNGRGKFYYQDGGYYEGQWRNNKMDGYGKLYYEGGKLAYEGNWSQDQFNGYGKVYNDNPMVLNTPFDYTNFDYLEDYWEYYEGMLMHDSKEGRGRIRLSNSELFEGDFHNDRIQGFGKFHTQDGKIVEGIWKESKLIKVINS